MTTKKKSSFISIIFVSIVLLFSSCSADSKPTETESVMESENTQLQVKHEDSQLSTEINESVIAEPADGYLEIGGLWEVGAIVYKNQILSIHDVLGLEDLYDTTYLSFSDDGSFLYINLYFTSGTYSRLKDNSFLLKTERVYRLDYQDGKAIEVDSTSEKHDSYIITLITDDENTLAFNKYDAITGKARANDDALYFIKSRQDSLYIDGHKVEISGSLDNTESNGTNISIHESINSTPNYVDHVATLGEKNALSKAESYLEYSAFSYSGLIKQLKYEGYTASEAKYGADNCGADWYEQSVRKAKEYIKYTAFSYSGLVEQLEYEGFTELQATHGADNCGADWYDQAVKKAREYLDYSTFSRSQLIEQLEYEGFSSDQAEYGVSKVKT